MAKTFHIISVVSDNVDIWVEDLENPKEAIKRYKELKTIGDDIPGAKTILFLVEGEIKQYNLEEVENE
jgi:hypothetical protein